MTIVVDTSALYSLVNRDDANHARVVAVLQRNINTELAITDYVVVEVLSLVSRRHGMDMARRLQRNAIGPMTLLKTSVLEHAQGLEDFFASGRRLSVVDCATMATMRARKLSTVLAFDDDFRRAGFTIAM